MNLAGSRYAEIVILKLKVGSSHGVAAESVDCKQDCSCAAQLTEFKMMLEVNVVLDYQRQIYGSLSPCKATYFNL